MNKWWGYLHMNGTLQVKRFFSREGIREAEESPFVEMTSGSFEAKDRKDAMNKLRKIFGMQGVKS